MPKQVFNQLTTKSVKSAKPGEGPNGAYVKRYADGGGLYLQVKPSGSRSWVFRATAGGKVRYIGLGSAGPRGLTLAEARDMSRRKAVEIANGEVPVSDKRKLAEAHKAAQIERRIKGTTFRDHAKAYIALNEPSWKNPKHIQQWHNTLKSYVYPHIGDMPICDIETSHVLSVLRPIWTEKPETANRIRGRIESVLASATVSGLRKGDNPARWRKHLDLELPPVSKSKRNKNRMLGTDGHHKAMPYARVPEFIGKLQEKEGIAALALEFTILTAARTGEVMGATWSEIDLGNATWTIPEARMKAGREHAVPLCERALELLLLVKPMTGGEGSMPIFPAPRGGALSNMAMLTLLKRSGETVTVHGFRSSFRDWAAEQTDFSYELCEMALAHSNKDKVAAAYLRGQMFDKRRTLMDAWSDHCAGRVFPKDGSDPATSNEAM